eukprot:CAMPEP_0115057402 /NCGR_PEP_ID=MMETSP0227-20121206/5735_1 /TAXON_ID=89957 /ORGANISM="Polarella glacialis, Strain CCMP 1383" /LENGTH=77 /DNA_ID=CAMNT_0002442195 /DNA_START=713 /DNA_END=942 /DNA_ORIENTATION=+
MAIKEDASFQVAIKLKFNALDPRASRAVLEPPREEPEPEEVWESLLSVASFGRRSLSTRVGGTCCCCEVPAGAALPV